MENLRNHISKVLSENISDDKKRIVAGALIKDVSTNKVFLLKRNDKTPIWAMVTGTVDQGEDVLDGLEREIYEELFIKPGDIRFNFMGVEHITGKNIDLHYYEAFVHRQFKPILDEENLDYGWFSLEDLPSPLFGGLHGKVESIINKETVFSDVKCINENLYTTKKTKDILDDVTDEKIGEEEYYSFEYIDELGGRAFGHINIENGIKIASIIQMNSQPLGKNDDTLKRRGFFKNLLKVLNKNNINSVVISLQSGDTRKAVHNLLDKKILTNPRNYRGVSTDQHPTLFDINIEEEKIFEMRKHVRLVLEHRILSDKYLNEAIAILMENDEPSPTFTWDFPQKEKKTPAIIWDAVKQKIDKSLSNIKTKEQAEEYVRRFLEKIKSLPKDIKVKLAKYIATTFVALLGVGIISSIFSEIVPDIEREVVTTVDSINKRSEHKNEFQYPSQISDTLIQFLKNEEGIGGKPVLTAYDLGDGAYTIGYGHAVFRDTARGDGGGKYDFLPVYNKITPGVTKIDEEQAEKLLIDDIEIAKQGLDRLLDEWKGQDIFVKIDQHMYDAMVSMIYNMGIKKFRTSEFIQFVKDSKFKQAADEIQKIDNQNLLDAYPGLVDRREKEKDLFSTIIDKAEKGITELKKIVRKLISEMSDNVLDEEIIDEGYTAQKELEKFTSHILKRMAERFIWDINYEIEHNYSSNLPKKMLPSAIHTNEETGEGYDELQDFIKDTDLMISTTKKDSVGSQKASYQPSTQAGRGTINLNYENYDLHDINSAIKYDDLKSSEFSVYQDLIKLFHSNLLHELQHAYDDWRSGGKVFKVKPDIQQRMANAANIKNQQQMFGEDLTDEEKRAIKKGHEEYLKLTYEINARFSQALNKTKLTSVEPDFETKKINWVLIPWDKVFSDFKKYFYGWDVLSNKMQRRLVQRLAKAYEEEGEKKILNKK